MRPDSMTSEVDVSRAGRVRRPRRDGAGTGPRGFTLLELVIAVTMLATFILPMLYIIAESRARALRYTIRRQVQGLAQEKLHDRIHYYEVEDAGTFEKQGHPNWEWEVDPPEVRTHGEQVVLTYTIRVRVPQKIEEGEETSREQEGSVYEYTTWTFPDERWYEEQQLLWEQGVYSPLYGYPDGTGGVAPPPDS